MAKEPEADVLSQSEVEAILASIGQESSAETTILGGKRRPNDPPPTVQSYDFKNPVFLSPERLRRLRIKHEEFIRALGARLSMYLRMEFALQMARLETIPYRNLLETLPMPSHLTLFRMKPLLGICLMDISPRLGLTVLDRMMGGPGHSVKIEREFTDIEIEVLGNFIGMILKEYCDSWLKYQKLEWEVIEHENTVRFLNLCEPEEIMLFLEMEARFGDVVAGLRFVIPYQTIEGLVEKLMEEIKADDLTDEEKIRLPEDMASPIYQIPVPISARWEGFSMTLGDLNALTPGDTILLDNRKCEQTIVQLGNLPKFNGVLMPGTRPVRIKVVSKIP